MKHKILKSLYQKNNDYVSGEELSKLLGISRPAVKKHIDSLIKCGYNILARKKSGYMLCGLNDILDEYSLKMFFDIYGIDIDIHFFQSTDSTNNQAKKLFGKSTTGIVSSSVQTSGKGRKGRKFVSGEGGVYVSYYCRPVNLTPFDAVKVVISAAVAADKTIKSFGVKSGIKWANDIFCGNKKLCGILCEMITAGEYAEFMVQGIGINVSNTFDDGLKDIAASIESITGIKPQRADVCAMLIKELTACNSILFNGGFQNLLDYYRQNCITVGNNVKVSGEEEYFGKAVSVDDNGFLVVETENGNKTVTYGDVSVLIEGAI